MIGRKTTLVLGELYAHLFVYSYFSRGMGNAESRIDYAIDKDRLYDFLYQHDYEAWFCNLIDRSHGSDRRRALMEFVLKVHTGETLASATATWSWEERQKLGQRYLQNLSEDVLSNWSAELKAVQAKSYSEPSDLTVAALVKELTHRLELDGYLFRDGKLFVSGDTVLDVEAETSLLQSLYRVLSLANEAVSFHHLALSEEHYVSGRWGDSISNARQFLESVLREVATTYSNKTNSIPLQQTIYTRPAGVRDYLQHEGLLESKEKDAISTVYGLLSNTGSHPYMAQEDQARLLRQLALTFSQFVMLRLKGALGIS